MIKVLLLDDQRLVRMAVESLLSADARIQVVAEMGHGAEAVDKARLLLPDIAIVDVDMPDVSGIEVTNRMVALPEPPRVIALSVHTRPPWPQRLLEAGARGYVPLDNVLRGRGIEMDKELSRPLPADVFVAAQVLRVSRGNLERAKALVQQFLDLLPEEKVQIETALAAQDLEIVRQTAHRLTSGGHYTGFLQISRSAGMLEQQITEGASWRSIDAGIVELIPIH